MEVGPPELVLEASYLLSADFSFPFELRIFSTVVSKCLSSVKFLSFLNSKSFMVVLLHYFPKIISKTSYFGFMVQIAL